MGPVWVWYGPRVGHQNAADIKNTTKYAPFASHRSVN